MAKNLRETLRNAILSTENTQVKVKRFKLFGQEVELRQPTLKQISKLLESDNKVPAVVNMMIEYLYVPGTDEHLFDKADADSLAGLPTGKWLTDFNAALEELTDLNVKEAEKN